MDNRNYFLPKQYRVNPPNSRDERRPDLYWNPQRLRNALIWQFAVYEHCAKIIARDEIKRVIDVGCGVGRKLMMLHERFPSLQITGIDQADPIAFCRANYDFGEWLVDDLDDPRAELENVKAELVICSDVIEHLSDPDVLLTYLRRRCAPGGHILLSTPDRVRLHGKRIMEAGQPDHVREWSFEEFGLYLRSRGFTIHEHIHSSPVRMGFHLPFFRTFMRSLRPSRRYRYSQVCLVSPPA